MLALIPIFPLIGFTILALFGSKLPKRLTGVIGCGTIAASGVITFLLLPQAPGGLRQSFGLWIEGAGNLAPEFSFFLDPLSATMSVIVCFVGFLIHVYSVEYMKEDPGFSRFFAYLNLFVCAMLILVLADDLLLLFLGWEGVGLCSYLLIGFWYQDVVNGHAAQKAFIVTRIGDVCFMIALFLLFWHVGTWSVPGVVEAAKSSWVVGETLPVLICLLIVGAAVGKSAQLPLHVWLPDAMAGPTPVSALIHAATMVTAGVYLIARLHGLFLLAPDILIVVGLIGAFGALYAGITALGQNDIKRVLAYSTMSQIGYMFLGLGVGAFGAAMLHFMTHAFFKALLFLGAGAVIHAVHGEQDMRQMGGLRKKLPLTFWTFVIGSAALAALPLITSGFYSKDAILWGAYANNYKLIWIIGVITAGLTGLYTTRMVVYTFFGKPYEKPVHKPGWLVGIPLVILAFFAIVSGFVEIPYTLGGFHPWQKWIGPVFEGVSPIEGSHADEAKSQIIAAAASMLGILLGIIVCYRYREWLKNFMSKGIGKIGAGISSTGFYWNKAYYAIFVQGVQLITRILRPEWVDSFYNTLTAICRGGYQLSRATQSGRVRWYAIGFVLGAIIISAGVLWL